MAPHETCEWLDAPRFAAWLRREDLIRRIVLTCGEPARRRIAAMANDQGAVSVWTADRWLTAVDRHLWEIPEGCWLKKRPPKKRGKPPTAELRARAAQMFEEGLPIVEIARRVEYSPRAVGNWLKAAA